MSIANVHVPVAKPRRYYHIAGIYYTICLDMGEFLGFPYVQYALPLNNHRTIRNNPALEVHGDDVTGTFEFHCSVWHLLSPLFVIACGWTLAGER